MSLIHNERTKLTATYLNGVAITIFAIGGFAPVIAIVNSLSTIPPPGPAIVAVICLAASLGLHLLARRSLTRLIP